MKAKLLIIPLILNGCASIYEPDLRVEVRDKAQYESDLADCREQAQSTLAESVVRGINPMAGGAMYGGGVPERIDSCMLEKGYDVEVPSFYL